MSITFNLELNNKPSKNKTYAILLRITQDKKHTRKKTSIEVKKKNDFNAKAKFGKWIRTSEPNSAKWNDTLVIEIEKAKKVYQELKSSGQATRELIKSKINAEETSLSFLVYAKDRTQEIFDKGGYRNFKKYNGFCNKLETFLATKRQKDLLFSEITTSFLSKFEAYLHTLKNVRNTEAKLHPNTISLTLRIFKTLINRAIQVDKLITPDQNPFLGYKYDLPKYAAKEKLTLDEIKNIEGLELEKNSVIWHCRNYFLFSFFMAGIRAGDLIQLRWRNITTEGRLEYRMGKTKKDRNIKIHNKAKNILNFYFADNCKPTDYIFPLLKNDAPYAKAVTDEQRETLPPELIKKLTDDVSSKNALINKYLKKIAEKANIDKNISFHISRHSFSRIAREKNVDNNHLKNILGHSNITITERYMGNFETAETDAVMSSIFDDEQDGKEKVKKLLEQMKPTELEQLLLEMGYEKSKHKTKPKS
jgi:integrase/recombinase XerD